MRNVAVLSTVSSMCKSRVVDQQVAACLWCVRKDGCSLSSADISTSATNILRSGFSRQYLHMDHSSAMTVTHVVNSLISDAEKPIIRTKACYILC